MKRLLVAIAVMLSALAACAVKDIKASDYDQSCAKDDDCVAVSELEAKGTDCVMSCTAVAINEKDKAQYDADLADEQKSCGSMASPFCDVKGNAGVRSGSMRDEAVIAIAESAITSAERGAPTSRARRDRDSRSSRT